ncbi:HesB/IscA family protein [Parvularcula dongshanensis]|uniref:Iron-sulfur cluster assembly accessory protein n=1 Tax=Parvularcula dongshanensis TaxID=1173995 RepID=A0A840I6Z7_9PROT|nr:iron-sulfur cluster assembly accessory protein [Parvularcula dongshanensis]MBB4660023.1 iron-sulfur cluster assembly accessory protein [Parvularcula dongshanensis]
MADGSDTPTITLTDSAARRIAEILSGEAEGSMLRIAVLGGGCSGFQYDYSITTEREDGDLLLEKEGGRVLIDETSQQYMPGATIDYAEELIAAAFKIDNPIATSGCGCGTSFSL